MDRFYLTLVWLPYLFYFDFVNAGRLSTGAGSTFSTLVGPWINTTSTSQIELSSTSSQTLFSSPAATSTSTTSTRLATGLGLPLTSSDPGSTFTFIPSATSTPTSPDISTTISLVDTTLPFSLFDLTTTVNNIPTVISIISGGAITSPITLQPSITISPDGTEASSSKHAIETQLISIFPMIESWLEDTSNNTEPIIGLLNHLENDAANLLSELPDNEQSSGHGCSHSLFSLAGCIVSGVQSITGGITGHITDVVSSELGGLKTLADELKTDQNDDQSSSSSSQSSEASTTQTTTTTTSLTTSTTSSCTSGTSVTEEYFVTCTPTEISSTTTETCSTSTSTITGCSVTAFTTYTTVTASSPPLCAQTGCPSCAGVVPRAERQSTLEEGEEKPDRGTNSSISRRTLPTPDDYRSYLDFFQAQLRTQGLLNVPHRGDIQGQTGSSSALLRTFDFNSRMAMTVQGLYGCTSIILISRKAVYMSHLFEDPGFVIQDPDSGLLVPGRFQVRNNTNPDQGVCRNGTLSHYDFFSVSDIAWPLPNGDPQPMQFTNGFDGEPWLPSLIGLNQPGEIFDRDQEGGVKAIIVTPTPYLGNPGVVRYPNEYGILTTWLSQNFDSYPMTYAYTTTSREESESQNDATGKILFQFDPAETVAKDEPKKGEPGYGCVRLSQYAALKLWIGYQEFLGGDAHAYYEDAWRTGPGDFSKGPGPHPGPDGFDTLVAREDNTAACTLESSSSIVSTIQSSSITSTPTTFSTMISTSTSTYEADLQSSSAILGILSLLGSIVPTSTPTPTSTITTTVTSATPTTVFTTSVLTIASTTSDPPPSPTESVAAATGTCVINDSTGQYGSCIWTYLGIMKWATCAEDSPCSDNNAACTVGSATDTSQEAVCSVISAASQTPSCAVPVGCENVGGPGECEVQCA